MRRSRQLQRDVPEMKSLETAGDAKEEEAREEGRGRETRISRLKTKSGKGQGREDIGREKKGDRRWIVVDIITAVHRPNIPELRARERTEEVLHRPDVFEQRCRSGFVLLVRFGREDELEVYLDHGVRGSELP